jgi:ribosome-binding protein aMBF1 (putative translation factor)
VKDTLEELIEDLYALSSVEYIRSIEEARTDYKEDGAKRLEDIFDA